MTPNKRKLVARLLRIASDKFSNHGCNDFDLSELLPDVEERRALVREMETRNGTPEDFEPAGHYENVPDWWLMSHFADVIEEESSTDCDHETTLTDEDGTTCERCGAEVAP